MLKLPTPNKLFIIQFIISFASLLAAERAAKRTTKRRTADRFGHAQLVQPAAHSEFFRGLLWNIPFWKFEL